MPFLKNDHSMLISNMNSQSLKIQLVFLQILQSQHISPAVVSLQKTVPRTKQGHPSSVWDLYHRHQIVDSTFPFWRLNHFLTDTHLLPLHFLKLFSSHPLLAQCFSPWWLQPVLSIAALNTNKGQKKGSGSPVPLKCGEAEPGHNFLEIHHQARSWFCLGDELSSLCFSWLPFELSNFPDVYNFVKPLWLSSIVEASSSTTRFSGMSLLPHPALFFNSLATFPMGFLCTFQQFTSQYFFLSALPLQPEAPRVISNSCCPSWIQLIFFCPRWNINYTV